METITVELTPAEAWALVAAGEAVLDYESPVFVENEAALSTGADKVRSAVLAE